MISKLKFSLIAVTMLVLLGFGFQNQAQGQIGLNNLFCPAVPDTTGWLQTEIVGSGSASFSGGLIGTVESSGGNLVGGLDWQHTDFFSEDTPTPTTESGSQLVSWWTQENARNTYIQVSNNADVAVTVHVRIHNAACVEIRDFCDTYTPYDTHQYNFGDLFSNGGASISDADLQGHEGWVAITAVQNCGNASELAIDHNNLTGQLIVHDSSDYLYGVNTYARQAICFDDPFPVLTNLILNGSFQSGALSPWVVTQGNAGVITADGISPMVTPPGDDEFMSWIASSNLGGFTSPFYLGGTFGYLLAQLALINSEDSDFETNVSVVQSNVATTTGANTLAYDLAFLAPNLDIFSGCNNYAAVLLINTDDPADPEIEDAKCYNTFGRGFIVTDGNGDVDCTIATSSFLVPSAISPFIFVGGASNFFHDTLDVPGAGTWVVQYVTGQVMDDPSLDPPQCTTRFFGADTGALVDEFEMIQITTDFIECDGTLDGSFNAMLDVVDPTTLAGQFNVLPGNLTAGADVVLINIADQYGPPYRPVGATVQIEVSIFDEHEVDQSCGATSVCFARLGIDDPIVISEAFAQPTGTPTATPTSGPITPTPTSGPITPTPTGGGGGGGSSSCAIAGNPVQLGTALANVLIPLVPVAFAFGVRAVRRRKK